MTRTARTTRRPLPAAVYWRRRLFVLGTVVALVLMLVGLVRGGDGPGADDTAAVVSGQPTTAPTVGGWPTTGTDESTGASSNGKNRNGKNKNKNKNDDGGGQSAPEPEPPAYTPPPLATPSGACADSDVSVSPIVAGAVAGRDVTITLVLRTREAAACTWRMSPNHLAVKITDGSDEVWTSRECSQQLPTASVVVRQAVSTTTTMTWNSRRSEAGCPRVSRYAEAGDYTIAAAALGGEPADSTFDLASPAPDVIEVPAEPSESPSQSPGQSPGQGPSRSPR